MRARRRTVLTAGAAALATGCGSSGDGGGGTDAAVEAGPATRPLPAEQTTVEDDSIRLG